MMMSLGMFVFSLPTLAYEDLQRRSDYNHAKSARIGARDATQFIGVGAETVSVSGTTYAEIADGAVSLAELRDMAASGNAWPLVDGAGRIYGAFVIEGVDEKQKEFLPDGTPLKIDFALDLSRVDQDAA